MDGYSHSEQDGVAAPRVGPAVALLLLVGLAIANVAYPLASDWPEASLGSGAIEGDLPRGAAVAIFAATYLVLAIGRLPGSRLDRAGAALLGASLMVAVGALTTEEAYRAIDHDTITLLLGMMILVGNLRLSGFFRLVNGWVAAHAGRPLVLLVGVVWSAGVLSAFLVNDAICLVLAPLVLELVTQTAARPASLPARRRHGVERRQRGHDHRQPAEHDDREPVGNPLHHLSGHLAPVAGLGLLVTTVMIAAFYPREFWTADRLEGGWRPRRAHGPLVTKSTLATVGMMAAFFMGVPPAEAAIVAGALLLLTRRVKPDKVYREIDLPLLSDVRGPVRRGQGLRRRRHVARSPGRRRPAAPRSGPDAQPGHRRPLQPGQQRPRRPGPAAVRHRSARPQQAWLTIAMAAPSPATSPCSARSPT